MISEPNRRRIEHVAHQRGYEFAQRLDDDTLLLSSSLAPGSIHVRGGEDGAVALQFELPAVARELGREIGLGAQSAIQATEETELYKIFGRAFELSIALPDNPLRVFQQQTARLPSTTEAERLVIQRNGQDIFRGALEDYWRGACALTGISDRPLLRASHIKPWAEASDAERLDVYNGILLMAHLDAAFDKHLVTFNVNGELVISSRRLSPMAMRMLNVQGRRESLSLTSQHQAYLELHRQRFASLETAP